MQGRLTLRMPYHSFTFGGLGGLWDLSLGKIVHISANGPVPAGVLLVVCLRPLEYSACLT